MANNIDFDVVVIGGGSAGYAAARTAHAANLKVAVVEGGKEIGGLCILRGCMPTKALLYASEVRHLARHAQIWGMEKMDARFDFAAVMARKKKLIDEFAQYRVTQLTGGRFEFIRANAIFEDAHTVRLSDGRRISSEHFIIATGSVVSPPPLPGLAQAGYMTSDDALSLEKLPPSLVVLGGGAVAVELAQFFARFDVKVTLIQRSPHILRDFDEDGARVVEKVLRNDGIDLFTGTKLISVECEGKSRAVMFEHDGRRVRVVAEQVLHALGRSPNTAKLGLENAGVTLDEGRVLTDHQMRSSVPNIFAAGDCTGLHEIVHIAIQQGEVAAHNIASPANPRTMDYRLLISVVFTDPAIATVGLTEKDAHCRNIPIVTASYPFNDHGKSMIMNALDGFVKLIADPKSGEILGGAVVGPHGGELIHEIAAAMFKRMTVHELASMPHYHPTLAEIWTYPAEELAVLCGTSTRVK